MLIDTVFDRYKAGHGWAAKLIADKYWVINGMIPDEVWDDVSTHEIIVDVIERMDESGYYTADRLDYDDSDFVEALEAWERCNNIFLEED